MKFSKFDFLDDITNSFGTAGALAIMIGGASCVVGLSGTGLVKVGEFLSSHQPILQRMMFYGSAAAGSGLFFVGVAGAASRLLDEVEGRETETKKLCRGCPDYQGGGVCALHGEVRDNCSDSEALPPTAVRTEKVSCINCKYYTGEELLPCTVHPLGLRQDCSDWEPVD